MSSADPPALHRSYLYAPGSRPDVMRKALRAGADAVILDLEDAVAPDAKDTARAEVAALLDEIATAAHGGDAGGPSAVHVRINRDGGGYHAGDLDAVVRPGLDALRLPKVEAADAVAEVAVRIDTLERERGLPAGHVWLYPTIESARGMAVLDEVAALDRVARFAFGTSDLLADLGIADETRWSTLYLRSALVLRSRLAGIGPPVDSVHTDLDDVDGLREAARHAASLGFHGKSVIHPRQLAAVHDVFTPSDAAIARARRIVAALDDATAAGRGAVTLDGEFVDAAVVARASALLALASDPDPSAP
ncbi:MAG TPA: CoA ester lyase [Egicoccus sp.]|nr:CoA ester lyase [Egicoccus sp.]HSK21784.1 CoA ester lyase [Egicoccus sp.]